MENEWIGLDWIELELDLEIEEEEIENPPKYQTPLLKDKMKLTT